jgi:ABC-type Mn2+/Zn2+ transport system ATPase subunit
MTPGVAEILASLDQDRILELEELELPSKVELELNVSDSSEIYRPIHRLSTGQKCTAILHLLLLESHEPLLVDQPEDNLDNSFIAGRIVTELRTAKQKRQFIFSTHNANIPVFGDSEWIGALKEVDGVGTLSEDSVGSIDIETVRSLVSEILEGGREAFEIRRAKYGY